MQNFSNLLQQSLFGVVQSPGHFGMYLFC